jgi:hypothetical protein
LVLFGYLEIKFDLLPMAWLHLIWAPFVLTYLMQPARLPGGAHGYRSVVQRHVREQMAWQQPIWLL